MTTSISYLQQGGSALETRPPVIVAGASEAARRRGSEAAEAAGFRIAATPLDALAERLTLQAAASALWIEIDEDGGADLDRLLDRIDRETAVRRLPAVVAAPAALLDLIAARITGEDSQILIDPGPAERAAALAIATAWRGRGERVSDITAEPAAARLRQLSDEVSRIAATLARLSTGPEADSAPAKPDRPAAADLPPVSGDTVRAVVRARRLRARYFDGELFADPAWDMLLDLFQADIAQHRVPVSSLCIAVAVPATTALRWIKTMTDAGLFLRRADPHDGRRVFVELSPDASTAMRRYFAEVGSPATV